LRKIRVKVSKFCEDLKSIVKSIIFVLIREYLFPTTNKRIKLQLNEDKCYRSRLNVSINYRISKSLLIDGNIYVSQIKTLKVW